MNKKIFPAIVLLLFIILGSVQSSVYAAMSPSTGAASTYAILSDTYTNTVPGTTINGDIGFTTPPAVVPGGIHNNYGVGAPYPQAGIDQNAALGSLAANSCTYTFPNGAIDLATDTTHGTIGVYAPGVYCITGAASIGTAGITLSGNGTFIFRMTGALDSVVNSTVTLSSGASSCNVWWTPVGGTTLGANSNFKGNVIDAAGITLGNNVTWEGRALAFGGTVTTTVDDTITVPGSCAPTTMADLYVVKHVINDNNGNKVAGDFTMNVTATNPSIASFAGIESPGQFITLDAGAYSIDETSLSGYAKTLGANCSGTILAGETKICIITNNDTASSGGGIVIGGYIVPRIAILKVPNPAALPNGAGTVVYTYTVTNPGAVELDTVSVTDDKCSSVQYIAGDTNNDSKLALNESWTYRCSSLLSQTTTNIATAVGYGYGRKAMSTTAVTVPVTIRSITNVPSLPNTGTGPTNGIPSYIFVIFFSIVSATALTFVYKKKFI